jgi:hypothetical protein
LKLGVASLGLGFVTLCVLLSSSALAAVRDDGPAPMSALTAWDTPFESGGVGCYDPVAWVWAEPRAERVSVEIPADTPCEIGALGCDRIAESSVEDVGFSALDETAAPESICDLKSKQHANGDDVEVFDAADCLEAEREVIAESLPVQRPQPQRPRGPSCSELGDECHPLPPGAPITTPEVVRAASVLSPTLPAPRPSLALAQRRGIRPVLGPSEGVRTGVDRPPAA